MEIKRLTRGDENIWFKALSILLAETGEGAEKASLEDIAAAISDERCYLLVALHDDEPVGLLSAYRFPDVRTGGHLAYLYDIEVLDEKRGRGIGKGLVNTLIACCTRDGVRLVWAGTDMANKAARQTFVTTGGKVEGDAYVEYEWDRLDDAMSPACPSASSVCPLTKPSSS
ncbi:GNAT family N-acetyltransferase [Aeromonas caviae]|uniref:GNAT family N-acetyltransferase n=1 Tax=Aeromonas caviae TaxID=648 RepID=UPI002B49C073|nr:GNAT family N-acetyltransferase [Aeromonas caviae]